MRHLLPFVLAVAAGCRSVQPGSLDARLILQSHDTVQFTADAWGRPCGEGRGLLLEGTVGGHGVLLWLRSGDSTAGGEYPVLARGDSTTPRGAVGAVRFMVQTADRGVTLDSGVVTASSAGGRTDATARGSGMDASVGQRIAISATFRGVPMAADTASCSVQARP